jgi:hypothetical protein
MLATLVQALVEELASWDDERLSKWAMDNRERITIDLLNWVATQEVAAAGADRDRLWALGSKLMALREGLSEQRARAAGGLCVSGRPVRRPPLPCPPPAHRATAHRPCRSACELRGPPARTARCGQGGHSRLMRARQRRARAQRPQLGRPPHRDARL